MTIRSKLERLERALDQMEQVDQRSGRCPHCPPVLIAECFNGEPDPDPPRCQVCGGPYGGVVMAVYKLHDGNPETPFVSVEPC
jgi:hypothetical protein